MFGANVGAFLTPSSVDVFSATSKCRAHDPFPSLLFCPAAHQNHLSQATKSYAQQQWLSVLVWTKMRPHPVDRFRQVAFHSHQNSKYFRAVLTAAMKLSALTLRPWHHDIWKEVG